MPGRTPSRCDSPSRDFIRIAENYAVPGPRRLLIPLVDQADCGGRIASNANATNVIISNRPTVIIFA